MNELAEAIESVRAEIDTVRGEILPDVGTLKGPTLVDGGASGDSVTVGPIASNISCKYRGLGRAVQRVVGGDTYTATHRLTLTRNATNAVITPKHFFEVQPRGNTGTLVFSELFVNEDSSSVFLEIDAALAVQGYRT